MALRTSLGDFEIDDYRGEDVYMKTTVWFVWLNIMIVGNVMFMNLFVAVFTQAYEKCMHNHKADFYRLKCDLIVERESIMNHEELLNKEYFPNYLVVRKPKDQFKHEEDQ